MYSFDFNQDSARNFSFMLEKYPGLETEVKITYSFIYCEIFLS